MAIVFYLTLKTANIGFNCCVRLSLSSKFMSQLCNSQVSFILPEVYLIHTELGCAEAKDDGIVNSDRKKISFCKMSLGTMERWQITHVHSETLQFSEEKKKFWKIFEIFQNILIRIDSFTLTVGNISTAQKSRKILHDFLLKNKWVDLPGYLMKHRREEYCKKRPYLSTGVESKPINMWSVGRNLTEIGRTYICFYLFSSPEF